MCQILPLNSRKKKSRIARLLTTTAMSGIMMLVNARSAATITGSTEKAENVRK